MNYVTIDRGWLLVLRDLDIDTADVVSLASLPSGVFTQETSLLTTQEYFAMLQAIDELADDPLLAIRIGQSANPEAFSAPLFAALCSSNLAVAVQRIAAHKQLMAPMHCVQRETREGLVVSWAWNDPTIRSPRLLMAMELVLVTQVARIATREPIQPVRVTCPVELEPAAAYRDFFGVDPVLSAELSLTFSSTDAHRPFLTANEALWASFEPELQRRVSKLDTEASMAERTRSVLLECLPSGEITVQQVARRLGVSSRTLQRHLTEEGETFRNVVKAIRERLAWHYLLNTSLTAREISFLLGFDEPSSFFRAFRDWTGQTPQSVRVEAP